MTPEELKAADQLINAFNNISVALSCGAEMITSALSRSADAQARIAAAYEKQNQLADAQLNISREVLKIQREQAERQTALLNQMPH